MSEIKVTHPVYDAVGVLFRHRHHLAPDVLRSVADIWSCASAARYGEPHEEFWELNAEDDFYRRHDVSECEASGQDCPECRREAELAVPGTGDEGHAMATPAAAPWLDAIALIRAQVNNDGSGVHQILASADTRALAMVLSQMVQTAVGIGPSMDDFLALQMDATLDAMRNDGWTPA